MQEFKEFTTQEEVYDWAIKSFSKNVLDHFDLNKQALSSPLSLYTGSISDKINDSLRKGVLNDKFSHFEGLQYDLCHNPIPENITVWRYITLEELLFLWRKTIFGRTYINPAFVSTTLLRDDFDGQSRVNNIVICINVPKGTPCMYIKELKDSAINEYEVLLAHHLAFKRTGKRTYETIPKLPEYKYCGAYVDEADYSKID